MINLPRVVAIGGGTGLATVLRGLKNYPISLSAIVTMTDNGASSGKLSRELGIQPPGDIRKCLAALASDETLLTQLFEYRFTRGRGLSGHSLGNLLLLALTEITGDFDRAIQASSQILAIKGRVIPSTLDHVSLLAQLKNSQMALGEVDIPIRGHRFGIKKITLVPERVKANPNAVRLIENANLILIGPGSLFTSVLPNFLIKDLRRAVEHSPAAKIYICNASTERGKRNISPSRIISPSYELTLTGSSSTPCWLTGRSLKSPRKDASAVSAISPPKPSGLTACRSSYATWLMSASRSITTRKNSARRFGRSSPSHRRLLLYHFPDLAGLRIDGELPA